MEVECLEYELEAVRLENKIKTYTREAVEVSCGPGAGAEAEPLCRSLDLVCGPGLEEGTGWRRGPDGHKPASCAPVSPLSMASLGGSPGARGPTCRGHLTPSRLAPAPRLPGSPCLAGLWVHAACSWGSGWGLG